MEQATNKQKSFLHRFSWVGIMLIVIGIVLGSVGIIMQFVPIEKSNFSYTVNDISQPVTEETLRNFRLLFLVLFGSFGLVVVAVGLVLIMRGNHRKRLTERLKREGIRLLTNVVDYKVSMVRINSRRATKLICEHRGTNGEHFVFTSGLLKEDPRPFLVNGQVVVYYDPRDPDRYFVDVDGSVANVR